VPLEDRLHRVEIDVQDLADGLGVERLSEGGRSLEVAEDDRDGLADFRCDLLNRELGPADPADAEPIGILLAAVGADLHAASV
jgi:hypothetical protein